MDEVEISLALALEGAYKANADHGRHNIQERGS